MSSRSTLGGAARATVQSLLNSVDTRDPNQSFPGFTAHPSSFLLSKLRSTGGP